MRLPLLPLLPGLLGLLLVLSRCIEDSVGRVAALPVQNGGGAGPHKANVGLPPRRTDTAHPQRVVPESSGMAADYLGRGGEVSVSLREGNRLDRMHHALDMARSGLPGEECHSSR